MKRALLDINVLLALFDANHVRHHDARRWLKLHIGGGWASCPITQNGFVRIISQPSYPAPIPAAQAIQLLRSATETSWHEFWPDDISILARDHIRASRIHGPKQLTDAYLLALAQANDGRFVTFDQRIDRTAVQGCAGEHLVVIS